MDAVDTTPAVAKEYRTLEMQEAAKHISELQKDEAYAKEHRGINDAAFLASFAEHMNGILSCISLLDKEVADLRQSCETLSEFSQDVSELKQWRISEERQQLNARLTKLEARLSEDSSRVERNDAELPEPSDKDANVLTTREYAMAAIESQRLYTFQESVYDAFFFVFAEHMPVISSILTCVAFLLNIAMQTGVIRVLSMNFTDDPFEDPYLDSLRSWRQSEGHSYRNADQLTGVSLTARVCEMDPALSLSGSQVSLVSDATSYLESQNGFVLCTISILLWMLTCAFEFRMTIQFVLALFRLYATGDRRTVFSADSDGLQLLGLSCGRMLIGCSIALCRSAIAVVLMFYGSVWLAHTTSLQDLLLNASALGFALDIDDIAFGVLATPTVTAIISSTQPLKLPKNLFILPVAMLIGVTASVILVEVEAASYIRDCLQDAHAILCDSDNTDLNFIIGETEAGWLVSATSPAYVERKTALVIAKREVTKLRIHNLPEANMYSRDVSGQDKARNLIRVTREVGMELEEVINNEPCIDTTGLQLGASLYAITGSLRSISSCVDVSGHCRGGYNETISRAVRLKCPITCGCTDPFSGIWSLAAPDAGCPWDKCQPIINEVTNQAGAGYECKDIPLNELEANSNWTFMLDEMRKGNMINTSVFNNLSSIGCPAFQPLEYSQRQLLCGTSDTSSWLEDQVFLGAGFMCPESCGCFHPYDKPPKKEDDDNLYIPGNPGLCPRAACAEKYVESAIEVCTSRGLNAYWFYAPQGIDVTCDE